jgi:Domain of unknown function (DUF4062)
MAHVRIFLSTVSNEFRSCRDRLAEKLKRPNLSVHVQEDFIAAGTETLDKLDDYIRECEAVVHLVGDMTGAMASPSAVAAITERYPDLGSRFPPLAETLSTGVPQLSYTQWEAFLALYHGKILIICTPAVSAPRDPKYLKIDAETAAQEEHLERLKSCHRYPEISFANADDLIIEVLRSKLQDILRNVEPSPSAANPPDRPWIYIGDPVVNSPLRFIPAGATINLRFPLKNVGKSPAVNVSLQHQFIPASPERSAPAEEQKRFVSQLRAAPDRLVFGERSIFQGETIISEIDVFVPQREIDDANAELIKAGGPKDTFLPIFVACAVYRFNHEGRRHFTCIVGDLHNANHGGLSKPFDLKGGDIPANQVAATQLYGGYVD